MSNLTPAQVPHPGKIIQKELDARGWTLGYLAMLMGMSIDSMVEECKEGITPRMAVKLGKAFGTSALLWARMDADYRVWRERNRDEQMQGV